MNTQIYFPAFKARIFPCVCGAVVTFCSYYLYAEFPKTWHKIVLNKRMLN